MSDQLTPNDWQSAIDVQDACNSQAIINSLSRLAPKIKKSVNGTNEFNTHPIVVMYAKQLFALAGGSTSFDYFKNYDICKERAKP